jgi:hypothetical protein
MVAQPLQFAHQGRLLDSDGVPITNSTSVFFSIWRGGDAENADTGTLTYSEVAAVTPDATGIFVHSVGTGTPLDATTFEEGDLLGAEIYLQVAVGTQDNVLLPRARITGNPYATHAAFAQDSDTLVGEEPDYYLSLSNHTGNISVDQVPPRISSLWFPAWTFYPESRHGSNSGAVSLTTLPTLDFSAGGQGSAFTVGSMPAGFEDGEIRYTLVWLGVDDPPNGDQDGVQFRIRVRNLVGTGGVIDASFSREVPAGDEIVETTIGPTSIVDSLNDGNAILVDILRNGVAAADTYPSVVQVLGIRVDFELPAAEF